MKIIGYGICGPGEANRYMRATLEEFKRLCDDTIILGNNITDAERKLIKEFGFKLIEDNREWGKMQWKIKQDFVEKHVARLKPDFCVCLDMDEIFYGGLTREWIENAPLDAYHVFVVDLWNDEKHYKPESCFWNVRLFRWNGETKFKEKPVHCGLAPQWAYFYHRFAPFLLLHYGLMKKEDRAKKVARYEKYDPNAHTDRRYYSMLKSDYALAFDAENICSKIAKEVISYQQTKPKMKIQPKEKKRFALVKNSFGIIVDIPEYTLADTLRQPGMTFVGWADDAQKEMEEMFDDVNVKTDAEGSYQKGTEEIVNDEKEFSDSKDEEGKKEPGDEVETPKKKAVKKTAKKKTK